MEIAAISFIIGLSLVLAMGKSINLNNHHIDKQAITEWSHYHFSETYVFIAEVVATVLVFQTGISLKELKPNTQFANINVYDDFDAVAFVQKLESRLNLSIPDEEASKIYSIAELVTYLSHKV